MDGWRARVMSDNEVCERECVLFIGTQFSILYTSMYSPAEAAKSATVCCCHCVGQVLAVTSSNKGSGSLRVFRVETHLSLMVARLVRYIQW